MKCRRFSAIVALCLSVALCGGLGESAAAVKKASLKMTVTGTEQGTDFITSVRFAELVKEKSGGAIKISVFSSDQLAGGNQTKGIEMLAQGITDIGIYANSTLAIIDERVSTCILPWTFTSYEQANTLFAGSAGEYTKQILDKKGIVYLDTTHNALRQVSNSKREIRKPEDVRHLKIRVPGGSIFLDTWKAFGADPIAMSWSEVFTALQQGTIDGQDNGVKTSDSNSIYEVNKFYTIWNYMYDGYPIIMNKKSWNKLDGEQRKILQEAATEACAWSRKMVETEEADLLKKFEQQGVKVTVLTEEEINVFKELVKPVIEKYKEKYGEEAMRAFGITQ
ncbi:conserved exported hypothetical protein [uncultured delta proteobacterium]|uniref:TRAP dicarboxylate transporter, DctP subunit n=1 Tax=uncultured delta proteobacterium TaxID=34034 RepID=A0A212JVX0_9DELT|nr:conserved exported hypothetical protein [uncultured delta proteobacterium]